MKKEIGYTKKHYQNRIHDLGLTAIDLATIKARFERKRGEFKFSSEELEVIEKTIEILDNKRKEIEEFIDNPNNEFFEDCDVININL